MSNPDKSPKELIEDLYELFSTFKKRMEDPNYIQIENSIQTMMKNAELALHDAKKLAKNNYLVFKYSETGIQELLLKTTSL